VLPDTSVTDLIHLIELAFENNKVSSLLGLCVYHTLLKLFKSVYNLEKVAVVEEKVKVFLGGFLYDCLHWEKQSVLIEVLLELTVAVCLQPLNY